MVHTSWQSTNAEDKKLAATVDDIQETMILAKGSIKNAAFLRKLTNLHPSVDIGTRWSGKVTMLTKFVKMRETLIEAQDEPDCKIDIDASAALKNAQKFQLQFKDINAVTKSMQTRLYTVKQCCDDLDALIMESEQKRNNRHSHWHKNKLEKYIGLNSRKLWDPHFVHGVVKIQGGDYCW